MSDDPPLPTLIAGESFNPPPPFCPKKLNACHRFNGPVSNYLVTPNDPKGGNAILPLLLLHRIISLVRGEKRPAQRTRLCPTFPTRPRRREETRFH